jgi:hypothetical protein
MRLKDIYRHLPVMRELAAIRSTLSEIQHDITRINSEINRIAQFDRIELTDFRLLNHDRYGDNLRLLRYSAQTFSQGGEDGIVAEICRRVGAPSRTFVEIGVGDGLENNTTLLLTQGWRGWWIDADRQQVESIEKSFEKWISAGQLRVACAKVTAENVSTLMQELAVPDEIDLFSLDIDRNTYWIWKAMKDFRPKIAVIEYNASRPPDVEWVVDYVPSATWNGSIVFGASLKSLELLGADLGYALVGCNLEGVNAFFVRKDLVSDNFKAPFTAENHYEPPRYALCSGHGHPRAVEG